MDNTESKYMLCANSVAMALYKESKETLITSNSYDFMVFRFSKWDDVLEDTEEWEESIRIDEPTYTSLHSNLCIKFRVLIKYI